MKNLIKNIFSVINKQDFKVITILGIKIKIFNSETLVNTDGYGWLRLNSISFNFEVFQH